jgi:oligopeptide transport system substrate-binding protein
MLSKRTVFLVVLIVTVTVACGPAPAAVETEMAPTAEAVVASPAPPPTEAPEPVTVHWYQTQDIDTLDPQMVESAGSFSEALFIQLTNHERGTSEIVPEAATDWQISEGGLIYEFTLRTDIPWVRYDPATGETRQELDGAGNPRFVTAHDFVYAIKRACDPKTGAYYSSIVAPLIKGCEEMLFADDAENVPPELVEAIAVRAPSDDRLAIELAYPAGYFMSMTPLFTLSATPQWAIEEHSDAWTEPGKIVTSGRYVVEEWLPGVRYQLLRNPLMPEDLRGRGNIERIIHRFVPDRGTGYTLWLQNEVDFSQIPTAELQTHLTQYPDEVTRAPGFLTYYLAFAMDKPPFDDVRVRRAFSAAFDRQTYADHLLQGQGYPMIHFAPPGVFGAPPVDEVGVGFDPEFARAQLSAAGYPDCEGFPAVTLVAGSGPGDLLDAEFAQAQWEEYLGCSPELIQIEQLPWKEQWAAVEGPAETRPHLWNSGWMADYPDENNFVGDVLWCGQVEPLRRPCSAVDELIIQAREESDPERRIDLYRRIEEAFFGPEGEMPVAPWNGWEGYRAQHSWLDSGPSGFGGAQWYNYTIDWEAKQAARGR